MIFYFIYEILIKRFNFFNNKLDNNFNSYDDTIEVIIEQNNKKNNLFDKYEINEINEIV